MAFSAVRSWMPGRFLRTFVYATPLAEPEAFDICPVLLAHPADDRWTDSLGHAGFLRSSASREALVMLGNAGHLPVEEPGASQLRSALLDFLAEQSHRP
jgi:alpha-beta hydrolase superfamily lysophospholipase